MFPREHGAYGQVSVPLLTALVVAGGSVGGACMTVAVVAGLFAHEPAAILLGARGARASREQGGTAAAWLIVCAVVGATAGIATWWAMPPPARWSLAVPAGPAVVLFGAMLRQREKSWYGEVAAALAFSTAAVPVVLAADQSLPAALGVAVPFALLFVTTTLAVRVVILRVRGGGDPRAAAATRVATLVLSVVSAVLLIVAAGLGVLPASLGVSSAPGLVTASLLALRPPPPTRLRTLGWTLVAVTALTALLIVVST